MSYIKRQAFLQIVDAHQHSYPELKRRVRRFIVRLAAQRAIMAEARRLQALQGHRRPSKPFHGWLKFDSEMTERQTVSGDEEDQDTGTLLAAFGEQMGSVQLGVTNLQLVEDLQQQQQLVQKQQLQLLQQHRGDVRRLDTMQ